jgi:hypothetical protein
MRGFFILILQKSGQLKIEKIFTFKHLNYENNKIYRSADPIGAEIERNGQESRGYLPGPLGKKSHLLQLDEEVQWYRWGSKH